MKDYYFNFPTRKPKTKKEMNKKQHPVERHNKEMEKHNHKQKLREARRKSGKDDHSIKPRLKKISIDDWDEWDEVEFDNYSRIMPLGSRERRREIEIIASAEKEKERGINTVDNTLLLKDRDYDQNEVAQCHVIEAGSSMCRVDYEGNQYICDIRGSVKDAKSGYINPVAAGDWVLVTLNGSGRGIVESVLPRSSVLARPYSPDQGKIVKDLYQVVAANVDRILIIASWREPYIWPALIDRYLITAQKNHIEPIICINKIDLVDNKDMFDNVVRVYQNLYYHLLLTSAVTKKGVDSLRKILQKGTTVLAGLSGVGKSSLLTSVQPSLNLKIGEVSNSGLFTGQGRHTTTQSRLWQLEDGGAVIDTPGVKTFTIVDIQPNSLGNWYPEMIPHLSDCRFSNCTHHNEPGCAVKRAVEQGNVSELRYKNYTQLYEELSST